MATIFTPTDNEFIGFDREYWRKMPRERAMISPVSTKEEQTMLTLPQNMSPEDCKKVDLKGFNWLQLIALMQAILSALANLPQPQEPAPKL